LTLKILIDVSQTKNAVRIEAIAEAIVDWATSSKEEHFVQGLKDEKRKYAWSQMTQAIREAAVE
jgi:hypothetical protein